MLSESLMISRQICLSDGRALAYAGRGEPFGRPAFFFDIGHDVFCNQWKQILMTLLSYRTTEENVRLSRRNGKHSGKHLTRHALAGQCSMSEKRLSTKQQEACEAGQQLRARLGG